MSDKKLLAEGTIRRFMKLANVDTLSDNFIETLEEREMPAMRDAAPTNKSARGMQEDDQSDADVVEEVEDPEIEDEEIPADDEMELDAELGAEDEAPADVGAADMSLTEEEARVLIDLGERLKSAMGPEAEEEDADVDAMADMEDIEGAPSEEEEEPAMGYDSQPMMEDDQDQIVQEVLKRVTKRLLASKLSRK